MQDGFQLQVYFYQMRKIINVSVYSSSPLEEICQIKEQAYNILKQTYLNQGNLIPLAK